MRRSSKTGSVVLILGGVAVGVLLLSPAGAHVSNSVRHLWNDHLRSKVAQRQEEETFVKVSEEIPVTANSFAGLNLFCPRGHEAIAGGVDGSNVLHMRVTSSGPLFGRGGGVTYLNQKEPGRYPAATGWGGYMFNADTEEHSMTVSVTCARL